jgi:hypothetical protein
MDTGETALNELVAQYTEIDKSSTHTPVAGHSSSSSSPLWYNKYMLYIALFVWTLVIVLVGRPGVMYVEDPETKERKIKAGRVIGTVLGIYVTVVGVVVGVTYYQKNILP